MCSSPTSGMVSTLIRSPAQVVAVGLAHRPERDLGDLRPATDHDDPLAEDAVEGAGQVDGPHVVEAVEGLDQCRLRDALDLELDLRQRRVALDPANGRERPDPAADLGDTRRDRRDRRPGVDDIEADRGGRGPAGLLAPRHQPSEPRPAAPGRRSLTDSASGSIPPVGSCSSNGSASDANASRVARRVGGRQHQRAVGVLGHADDAGDVDPALAEGRCNAGERTRPIVELDREPDRHRGTSCVCPRWYPGRPVAQGRPASRPGPAYPARDASPARQPADQEDARDPGLRARRFARDARRAALLPRAARRRPLRRPQEAPDRARRAQALHGAPGRRPRCWTRPSRAYRDAGLGYLSMDDAGIVARLQADPRLLRLPLARHGNEVTVGPAEATWARWVRPKGAS